MMKFPPSPLITIISILLITSTTTPTIAITITITNECPFPIWPATAPNTHHQIIASGGFYLPSRHTRHITTPPDWSGRIWARTHCKFPSLITSTPACLTGDCGGQLSCGGLSGTPPATLIELTLSRSPHPSFYDVSLVDGYNLPVHVSVNPYTTPNNCSIGGCFENLKDTCPPELRVVKDDGEVVACKSGCLAFGNERFCCTGEYSSGPEKCGPTVYSQVFKRACPWYVSYAFDQKGGSHLSPSAVVSCEVVEELVVTFCPDRWGGGDNDHGGGGGGYGSA